MIASRAKPTAGTAKPKSVLVSAIHCFGLTSLQATDTQTYKSKPTYTKAAANWHCLLSRSARAHVQQPPYFACPSKRIRHNAIRARADGRLFLRCPLHATLRTLDAEQRRTASDLYPGASSDLLPVAGPRRRASWTCGGGAWPACCGRSTRSQPVWRLRGGGRALAGTTTPR